MNKKPLLSICIPTYNRCQYLKKTIDSIVSQNEFSDFSVEIVVSDNCSTDDTQQMMLAYAGKYPNVFYYRNDENINDRNFPLVLTRANGCYRKLINDALVFKQGALKTILDVVNENIIDRPVIFFNNLGSKSECFDNMDSFLRKVSYQVTWIGGFGVWEDFLLQKESLYDGCELKLWQENFLLNYLFAKKKSLVVNGVIFEPQIVAQKNMTYGLYKVFYVNYLGIVKKYIGVSGGVTDACYEFLQKDLLFRCFTMFLYRWECQNGKGYVFSSEENFKSLLTESYKRKPYWLKFKIFYFCYKCLKKTGLDAFAYKVFCFFRK